MDDAVVCGNWVHLFIKKILMTIVISLFLITTTNVSGQSNSDCSTCHSFPDPSDGYVYDPPVIFINVPFFVDLHEDFTIEAGLDFNEYEIKEITLTIAQDQPILDFEKTTIKANDLDERTTFDFKATTLKLGVTKLSITAEVMVYFDHAAGEEDDYREESIVKYALVSVGPTYLEPSSWSILLGEKGEIITLTAIEDITDLKIIPPSSLTASPTETNILNKGGALSVKLSPVNDEKIDDNIIVTWKQEGTPYALTIGVVYNPETEGGTDYHSWVGRITGIACIILLILSLILGGMWNTKGLLNRIIKSSTRIKIHCAVSWFLFALALYHGLNLLISPYSQKLWNPWIVLGEIGALSMLVVGLTGSYMKFTIKLMGARKWRGFHLYATFAALVLSSIHGIRIGTDLAFIRDNMILSRIIIILLAMGVVLSIVLYIASGKKSKKKTAADRDTQHTKKSDLNKKNSQEDYNWNTRGSRDYYMDDYYDNAEKNHKKGQPDYYGDDHREDY